MSSDTKTLLSFSAQSFHLPVDASVPVILVGNGTGISPFRAFWQQRMFDINNKCPPESSITRRRQWGDMRLFFGCRNSRLDDIYRHETSKNVKSEVITNVTTAYSREDGKPKVSTTKHARRICRDLASSFTANCKHQHAVYRLPCNT